MKTIAILALGSIWSALLASAQEIHDHPSPENHALWRSVPNFRVETAESLNAGTVIDISDVRLDSHLASNSSDQVGVDIEFLKEPTSYLDPNRMEMLQAAYQNSTTGLRDAHEIQLYVLSKIHAAPETACEIVREAVDLHPDRSCEIVKAAIEATEANEEWVLKITETAIQTSPEHMRLIAQCAMASAPESMRHIQMLLARLDPQGGDSGSTAKDAKVSIIPLQVAADDHSGENPLDLLAQEVATPDPIIPPPVSRVDP